MSVRASRIVLGATTLLTTTTGVWAHDGHGSPQWLGSALHYLLEPLHLPLACGVLAILILSLRKSRRERQGAR